MKASLMRIGPVVAVLGLVIGAAGQARAALTFYADQSAFLGATSGLTTIDFNGIAPAGSFVGYGNGPLTLSGVTFSSNGSMFVIDPGYYGSPYAGGGFLNSDFASPANVITATLPASATAIGLNFGALFEPTGSVTFDFTLSDGSTYSATTSSSIQGGLLDFIGVTSTLAFASVSISMPDAPDYNAIDNFQFGTAVAPVPEPSTFAGGLLGVALMGGAWLRRRKPAA